MPIESTDDSLGAQTSQFLLNNAIWLLSLVLLIGGAGLYFYYQWQQERLMRLLLVESAGQYAKALTEFRSLYTDKVVSVARTQGVQISHNLDDSPHALPLPATLTIMLGNRITAANDNTSTRLFSPFPFPWRAQSGGLRDDFDRDAWRYFQQFPDRPYYRFYRESDGDRLRYATADRMRQACIGCHNSHPDSPRRNWQVGDVRGIISVTLPLNRVRQQAEQGLQGSLLLILAVSLIAVTGLYVVIRQLREAAASAHAARDLLEKNNIELAEANRELTEFNYIASHDLQEPLRTLESYTSLLKQDVGEDLSDDATEDIQFITESTVRMRRLVQDLLILSRTKTQRFKCEVVDLGTCMQTVTDNLQGSIIDTGGKVVWQNLPKVVGDTLQLERVLQNLVANGLKFHDAAAPMVEVTAQRLNDAWKIAVIDNGIGIDPQYHQQIFTPFKRLHGDREYEGTGIGLASVRKIVERHGGDIGVESKPGDGSCFWFTLPYKDPD